MRAVSLLAALPFGVSFTIPAVLLGFGQKKLILIILRLSESRVEWHKQQKYVVKQQWFNRKH